MIIENKDAKREAEAGIVYRRKFWELQVAAMVWSV